MKWHVYILKCSNESFYIGVTSDFSKRILRHEEGQGASFTKVHGVEDICYLETYSQRRDAFLREKQIKGWTRKKKLALINGDKELLRRL